MYLFYCFSGEVCPVYKHLTNAAIFAEAEILCRNIGMELAVVKTTASYDNIMSYLNREAV